MENGSHDQQGARCRRKLGPHDRSALPPGSTRNGMKKACGCSAAADVATSAPVAARRTHLRHNTNAVQTTHTAAPRTSPQSGQAPAVQQQPQGTTHSACNSQRSSLEAWCCYTVLSL